MTVRAEAARHYTILQRIKAAAVSVARRQWRQLPPNDIVPAYQQQVGREVLAGLMLAQLAAADEADGYVGAVLRKLIGDGARSRREGRLIPDAFAGVAADGRPLESLLHLPVIRTLQLIEGGMSPRSALQVGENMLSQIVATETTDAGRTADGVAIAARPQLKGYVRMLTPPSCARCVILAGRVYRWSAGFQRHPNCDCIHIPVTEDVPEDLRTDPMAAFRAGQVRGLSKADEQAIRDGADINQVVNARRGMYTAGGKKFTTEGTSRRGRGGRPRIRLRPEQIYREANGNREEAIRLLRLHGYIL